MNKDKKGKVAAPPPTLEDELRAIWSKPFSQTPINKDLPRLAPRMTVVKHENGVLSQFDNLDPASKERKQVLRNVDMRLSIMMDHSPVADLFKLRENDPNAEGVLKPGAAFEEKIGSPLAADKSEDEKHTSELKSFHVWILKQVPAEVHLKKRATDYWTAWDGPGILTLQFQKALLIELKLKNQDPFCTVPANGLLEMLDSSRYFVVKTSALDKELIYAGFAFHTRVEAANFREMITDNSQTVPPQPANIASGKIPPKEPLIIAEPDDANAKIMKSIKQVVIEIARAVESKEIADKFEKAFQDLNTQKISDFEVWLPDIWKAVGDNNKVVRVLKAIHQNIIFTAIFHLKQLLANIMTRDVRTPEGWRIFVHILADVVVITHVRREQALATQPPEEYFWIEWQLRMIFDANMTVLRAARLRIVELGFGPKTTEAKKAQYNLLFGNGNLILY